MFGASTVLFLKRHRALGFRGCTPRSGLVAVWEHLEGTGFLILTSRFEDEGCLVAWCCYHLRTRIFCCFVCLKIMGTRRTPTDRIWPSGFDARSVLLPSWSSFVALQPLVDEYMQPLVDEYIYIHVLYSRSIPGCCWDTCYMFASCGLVVELQIHGKLLQI